MMTKHIRLTFYNYDFSSGTAFQSSVENLFPSFYATHFQMER